MNTSTLEAMREQVRVIYRAVTGSPLLDDSEALQTEQPLEETEVERRFAELDTIVRTKPELQQRIPPFSFTPPVDVLESQDELLVEVAVPGVVQSDISVELHGSELIVSGVRRAGHSANGHVLMHAEIPRGPFKSVVHLPFRTSAPTRVEVEQGIALIQLQRLGEPQPA